MDAGTNLVEQRIEACAIAELNTRRDAPFRQINVARQRDLAVAGRLWAGDKTLRAAQNIGDWHAWIGGDRYERRVGAVLQEPPYQIGQQIAMAADRRIDAAGGFRQLGEQRLVERLAHAVEPLEFKTFDATGVLDDAGDRQ